MLPYAPGGAADAEISPKGRVEKAPVPGKDAGSKTGIGLDGSARLSRF